MYEMRLPIALVTATILAFGAHQAYRGFRKTPGSIYRYLFPAFLLLLVPQVVGIVGPFFTPQSSAVIPVAWVWFSQIGFWLIHVAYALIAYGCFVSTRRD